MIPQQFTYLDIVGTNTDHDSQCTDISLGMINEIHVYYLALSTSCYHLTHRFFIGYNTVIQSAYKYYRAQGREHHSSH
jgi:hypothetical protein